MFLITWRRAARCRRWASLLGLIRVLNPRGFPRVVRPELTFAQWILANVESEEIKAQVARMFPERVGDASLAGFEFQSQACQPLRGDLLAALDNGQVVMQDHKVVGIAHDLWLPGHQHAVDPP